MSEPFGPKFIAKVKKDLTKNVISRADKIAITALSRLVSATDVDYGQARSGWNLEINRRNEQLPVPSGRGPGERSTTVKETYAAPGSQTNKLRAKKLGDSYFITNSVGHIIFLNEGTGTTAPENFIEIELAAAVKSA